MNKISGAYWPMKRPSNTVCVSGRILEGGRGGGGGEGRGGEGSPPSHFGDIFF